MAQEPIIAIVIMGLYTTVLTFSHHVPGWKKGFSGQSTATDREGAGVVRTSRMTAVLIKGGSLGRFTHRQSTMNDTVRSQGSTRKSRERPRTNLP